MKSLINVPLMIEQLKRFWAIGAAFMLAYLLLIVLPLYSATGGIHDPHRMARNLVDLLSMSHFVSIAAMLLAPFCAAIALYPYHFNANATTAFYTFPVSKKQLFWTNMAAALILLLLPLLILCLILLIPIHYTGSTVFTDHEGVIRIRESFLYFPAVVFPREVAVGAAINTFPVVAGFFARMAIGFIFYYGVFLAAISVSGNRVIAILLCGAFPLIPAGVFLLMEIIASSYLFGYVSARDGIRTASVLAYTNPVMWESAIRGQSTFPRIHFPGAAPILSRAFMSYIVIAGSLISISYACGHRRKLERTGDSVVFAAFKNVCVFIVTMVGMIVLGVISMASLQSRVGLYVGFVIGFVIFYLIAQMIAEKSFNISHKIKGLLLYGGIVVALYIGMLCITHFGMSFYVNRVPQASEIARVSLHHSVHWGGLNRMPRIYTDNPEAIAGTVEVHQRILDNQRYLRNVHWQVISGGGWTDTFSYTLPITYLMQDGTVIYRQYRVSRDFMATAGIAELMSHPAVLMSQYPAFSRPEVIELIRLHYWNDQHDEMVSIDTIITNKNEIASFLDAVTADLIAINADSWYTMIGGEIFRGDQWYLREIGIGIQVYNDFALDYRSPHISLRSHMSNTQEWIQRYLDWNF